MEGIPRCCVWTASVQGALCLNCCWCESNTLHWRITTARHLGQEEYAILSGSPPTSQLCSKILIWLTYTCSTHTEYCALTNADTHTSIWMHTQLYRVNIYLTHIHTYINLGTACAHCMSPLTLIFIRLTMVGMLTVSPAPLLLNVSIIRGLHQPRIYTVTGHDLISAAISLTSPTRCLFNLILPET